MKCLALPTPNDPISATHFVASSIGVSREKREEMFFELLREGHVPARMRTFLPVSYEFVDTDGNTRTLEIYVLPDYLQIGTDSDSFIVPLWPLTAQKIADEWECMLPTTKLVTEIWKAATKVSPQPWGPPYDHSMMSTDRIIAHNARVEVTMKTQNVDRSMLVAGHKKDVVITNKLVTRPKKVAIFGWHMSNGKPIQPLYLGHVNTYGDYSHGIRLIDRECRIDGQLTSLGNVMQDPVICNSVSNEGMMLLLRQPSD